MKKIFTLMLAMYSLTAVFAQQDHSGQRNDSRDIAMGKSNTPGYGMNDRYHETNIFTARERDQQIKQVNKDFDRQIFAVRKNRSIWSFEKDRQIRNLENQRNQQIREINDRFMNQRNAQYGNQNGRKW